MVTTTNSRIPIIIRSIAFVLLFSILFVAVSYLFRPTENAQERDSLYGFYAEPKNSFDMVYIGGSVCIVCWAPYVAWHEEGISSYAFGASQILPSAFIPLIKEVYKRQSPELLVLDLRPFQYSAGFHYTDVGLRFTSDSMPYSLDRCRFIHDTLPRLVETPEDALAYYADLIKYHSEWQHLTRDSFQLNRFDNALCATKGFVAYPRWSEQSLQDHSAITSLKPVSELAENALRELLTFLKSNHQQAIFVVTAYAEADYERENYNYLKGILDEAGFAYWNANDFRDEIGVVGETDFYDCNHMNIFGAEKYTAYLSHYLAEEYDLPDRRDDPAYASWPTGYEKWCTVSDDCKHAITELIANAEDDHDE